MSSDPSSLADDVAGRPERFERPARFDGAPARLPRRRQQRGAGAVEWIIACVFIAITSIGGLHTFSASFRCRVAVATSSFGGDPAASCPGGDPACAGGSCSPNSGNCFVAGTLVDTESGPQPIESLAVGTRVLSRDEGGAPETSWQPVVRTFRHIADDLVRITFVDDAGATESLEVTAQHRLRVAGRGWLEAGALEAGVDRLERLEGAPLAVVAVASVAESAAVYNVEVAGFHSYYVGAHHAWVHNDCGSTLPTNPGDANNQKQPGWIWAGNSWTGGEIRQHYNDMIAQIKQDEQTWKQEGLSLEQQARNAYDIRHNARMTARAMMGSKYFPWLTNWIGVANLQYRDWKKYGNGDGPTFQQLFDKAKAKGMTDEEAYQSILDSSGRTDPGYNSTYGATNAGAGPQIGNSGGPPAAPPSDPSAEPDS